MNKFSKVLIATIFTLGAIAGSASSWAQQSLKVAGQDVPPWVVHDKGSNALSGISVDLMSAIAKDAGLRIQYEVMTLADLIPAVSGGKIDVIATNLSITPERRQQVDFSNPFAYGLPEVVVVLASDTTAYRTLAELKGLPVGSPKGSIQLALLQKTSGFSEIKVYDTDKDAWAAVASGAIKAAITAGTTTMYAAKQGQLTNLRIVSSYQSSSPRPEIGIAVKKGNNELLGRINNSLARLMADGTVRTIFSNYGLDNWERPNATDIAWRSKAEPAKRSWIGAEGSYERTGTAEVKTGEKTTFICNGMYHLFADKNNQPWDQQCVYRFDDLSAFIIHLSGSFNASTLETKGAGKFIGGAGRFEGIAGEVTMVGHFSGDIVESDAVGSYSLPVASRGVGQ